MSGILMIFFLQYQTMVSWWEKNCISRAFTYFLLLDPSQFWNLDATRNLANKETLELLTDSDGNEINISNFNIVSDDKVNYYIKNSTHVLEADFKNKVKVNTKDKDNRRQLWKKGCPNYKGFFMIENSESRMLLTVATDASKSDYSIELIGLFKTI